MPEVKIMPKGTTFKARKHESILQAALKAGLSPNYGCSNGNCGDCLARLVSGEISKISHFDFVIPEHEKASGHFLTCCHRAENDIVIETAEASAAADIPVQNIEVRVKNIEHLNEQIIKLHLRTPRSKRLRFMAGQSVSLSAQTLIGASYIANNTTSGATSGTTSDATSGIYPIASCPCDEMNLYFNIPNIPGDAFSEWLFAGGLKKNQKLNLTGPTGHFVLGNEISRPLLMISWHTGFASLQSLMEHAIALETENDIHLYRLSPTPAPQYLDNLCRSWSDAFDNIHYSPLKNRYTLMSEQADGVEILTEIAHRHTNLLHMDIYVVGPPSLIFAAKTLFTQLGLPKDQLQCETIALGFFDEFDKNI